jgi:hypothetical protein
VQTHIAAVQCDLYAGSYCPQEWQWCEQCITATAIATITISTSITTGSISSSDHQTMLLSPPVQQASTFVISVHLLLRKHTLLCCCHHSCTSTCDLAYERIHVLHYARVLHQV